MKVYYTNGVKGCASMIVAAENRPQLNEVMAEFIANSGAMFDDTGAIWIECDLSGPGAIVIHGKNWTTVRLPQGGEIGIPDKGEPDPSIEAPKMDIVSHGAPLNDEQPKCPDCDDNYEQGIKKGRIEARALAQAVTEAITTASVTVSGKFTIDERRIKQLATMVGIKKEGEHGG